MPEQGDKGSLDFSQYKGDFGQTERIEFRSETGGRLGHAELVHFAEPLPFYYIKHMEIDRNYRGNKFGKEMLEQLNEFIRNSGEAGILAEEILADNMRDEGPAAGMYERNGWKPVQPKGVSGVSKIFVYNLPPHVNLEDHPGVLFGIAANIHNVLKSKE